MQATYTTRQHDAAGRDQTRADISRAGPGATAARRIENPAATLFALLRNHWAPRWIADKNRLGSPWKAILACTSAGYIAVIMSYVAPDTIFNFIINSVGAVGLFVYAIIAGSQLRMRRQMENEASERLKLRMWGYPYLSWITLAAILVVVSSMLFVPDARSQLYLSALSLAVILATYLPVRRRQGAVPEV